MNDESLREFQLNGKQLVFLFMASTIVAVVIFLCGVMVGRGVSAAAGGGVTNSLVEVGDPTAGALASDVAPSGPVSEQPVDVPPDAPGDGEPNITYPESLTAKTITQDVSPPSARKAP